MAPVYQFLTSLGNVRICILSIQSMITKIPQFIRRLFPNRLWKVSTEEKILYLTLDDGPIPEVTPWVLEQLEEYEAKATFFCIGDNIQKNSEMFQQILSKGHRLGNHTFNHLNGWRTSTEEYIENILMAEEAILSHSGKWKAAESQKLFRPPYGRITGKQAKLLMERNYKIVMWDILSRDYNETLSPEKCVEKVIKKSKPGSILVFHDSLKAEKNIKAVLPRVLEYYSSKGYSFGKL